MRLHAKVRLRRKSTGVGLTNPMTRAIDNAAEPDAPAEGTDAARIYRLRHADAVTLINRAPRHMFDSFTVAYRGMSS